MSRSIKKNLIAMMQFTILEILNTVYHNWQILYLLQYLDILSIIHQNISNSVPYKFQFKWLLSLIIIKAHVECISQSIRFASVKILILNVKHYISESIKFKLLLIWGHYQFHILQSLKTVSVIMIMCFINMFCN